jgi:enoyl-CoA hydratase
VPGELVRRHEGHVTRLTLNRPDKSNALSASLVEALLDAVDYACTDGTRLLVLDAEGRHFSAGFDFTGFESDSDGDLALRFIRIETLLQRIYHAPFATAALAHGRVFGAGADIIASCSIRIAEHGTTFRMPGLRFGVVLGTRRLMHRVGADRARSLLSASATFSADEAVSMGFLTRSCPRTEWPALLETFRQDAETLAMPATRALYDRTVIDTRADDMNALALSVSVPGIRERIRIYRESMKG